MRTRAIAVATMMLLGACKVARRPAQSQPAVTLSDTTPVRLVREYVTRDADGQRIRANPWFFNVVIWPEDPGWDSYAVIRNSGVDPIRADSSTARVSVTYEVVGHVETTGRTTARFVPDSSTERFVFTVALTDNGWRIVAPQIDPHLLPGAALSYSPLSQVDRGKLRALLSAQ
jgi:hypothetical protein